MNEKKMLLFVADKLKHVTALLDTASIAVGNIEYFERTGQNIALSLDIAIIELKKYHRILETIIKHKRG